MESIPSASYSLTLRVEFPHEAGALGKILTTIGEADGLVGAVDIVRMRQDRTVRDITVNARDSEHGQQVVQVVEDLPQVKVINVSDRTFLMHLGGKIEVRSKLQIRTRDDLSMVYTPGVARVCRAIASDPERAFNLTIKRNTVAVVSDGTAVLGLGDIGPRAAMPVMEGKAALFKQFANVDAFPICLDTKDHGRDSRDRQEPGARVRRHKPGGYLGPAVLRDRRAAEEGSRHPCLPRRPARHGRRGAGRPDQLPQDRGQGGRRPPHRRERRRRLGGGLRQDHHGGGREEHRRLRLEGHRPRRTRGPQRVQALVRREHEPRGKDRRPLGRRRGGRPLPRALGAGRAHHRARREHERRPHHLRDGQPRPRDKARGRDGEGEDHRNGPQRLPEPDQQRPLLPRHLQGRPRCEGP